MFHEGNLFRWGGGVGVGGHFIISIQVAKDAIYLDRLKVIGPDPDLIDLRSTWRKKAKKWTTPPPPTHPLKVTGPKGKIHQVP